MLLEMAVYQESDVFAMNPIANVDSAAVSNLEGKEYIRFVWNEISSNQINSKYTLSESILRTIYSHHCVGRNLRKAALLALAEGLNYGKVIASWGEGHNKSQKTGMIGAPIMIDGVKYLLCVTTMRNRNHVIKPYAITLKDANGNNVEEKTVVGNNLVHDSNNGDSTSGNNRLSTITASHHTNTPLSSNAKVQQNIQTNKQNNENIQYYSMNNNRIRLTESQLRRIVKESVDSILKEGSKKKDPMAQWFNDFNKASKYRETMDYVNKGGRNPLSNKKEDDEINESYNKLNGLHRLAYENQGMKEKIKEVAQFADIVAGVARSEGRDNYVKFYKQLASNIFQMLNLWGFLDDMDD